MSLTRRLLLSASVLLLVVFAVVGWILDAGMRDALTEQIRQRLEAHIYTLLATLELKDDGSIALPDEVPEPRLMQPDSGLYAIVSGQGFVWRSASTMGEDPHLPTTALSPGDFEFLPNLDIGPEEALTLRYGIVWVDDAGREFAYTLSVAEDRESLESQVEAFRGVLWFWAAITLFVLALVQVFVLRWGLRPLKDLRLQVSDVREGRADAIHGEFPSELSPLVSGLNAFITGERENLQRQRNQLSDLAHSLKTPLAALRGMPGISDDAQSQVDAMDQIVAYQLKRARTSGKPTWAKPVSVLPVAERIVATLEKLYRDRQIACEFELEESLCFFGDAGDLSELLGNLLENAFKWCKSRVFLSGRPGGRGERSLILVVEDDGDGIAEEQRDLIVQRGVRADERVAGHGIGLAIVATIVESYEGDIVIGDSSMGGAKIEVRFS